MRCDGPSSSSSSSSNESGTQWFIRFFVFGGQRFLLLFSIEFVLVLVLGKRRQVKFVLFVVHLNFCISFLKDGIELYGNFARVNLTALNCSRERTVRV
jgi:hypothetical protein